MRYLFLVVLATVLVFSGCGDDSRSGGSDSDIDTDSDTDNDADTDTDTGPNECTQDLGEYSGDFVIDTPSDVANLAGYTSISGNLASECSSCTDFNELICLASVGGDLYICNNPVLTNLDGLGSLTSVGGLFWMYSNAALPDCEVCDLLDQLTSGSASALVQNNLDDSCTPVPANCP